MIHPERFLLFWPMKKALNRYKINSLPNMNDVVRRSNNYGKMKENPILINEPITEFVYDGVLIFRD